MGKTVKSHQLIRKKYAKVLVLFLVFATALSLGGLSFPAYATDCPSGVPNCCPNSSDTYVSIKVNINGTYTNCVPAGTNGDVQTNPIFVWAIGLLKFLAGGVGIGVTAGIVWGGDFVCHLTRKCRASQKGYLGYY